MSFLTKKTNADLVRIFAGPRVQYAGSPASLHASLDRGIIPADLLVRKENRLHPLNPEVARAEGRDRFERSSASRKDEVLLQGACWGLLTGAMAAPFLPCLQWAQSLGMAAAVAVPIAGGFVAGLAIAAWFRGDQQRDLRGETTVDLNGAQKTVPWQGDPQLRTRSAQEVTAVLTALGELGDEITPGSVSSTKPPDGARSAQFDQYAPSILELARQRRLVADLGQSSKLGHSALQVVDATGAREVFSGGGQLYLVEVTDQKDVPKSLRANSFSDTRQWVQVDQYSYLERTLEYRLVPVQEADQLSDPKLAGTGLPEGVFGVYAQQTSYRQVVARSVESGTRSFPDDTSETRRQTSEHVDRAGSAGSLPAGTVPQTLDMLGRNSARALAIAGGLIGMAGAALLGFEPITAGACVATAGYLIGRNP